MTLTVRLDSALESALERFCAERGLSKSLVVQESLASYLLADQTQGARSRARQAAGSAAVGASANYQAFAAAGLIGAGTLGSGPADKAAVRARAVQRVRRAAE